LIPPPLFFKTFLFSSMQRGALFPKAAMHITHLSNESKLIAYHLNPVWLRFRCFSMNALNELGLICGQLNPVGMANYFWSRSWSRSLFLPSGCCSPINGGG